VKAYELTVRCSNDSNHAKKLRIKDEAKDWVDHLAALLDGSSQFYILKPGALSPIGKCATCGSPVTCLVEEVEIPVETSEGEGELSVRRAKKT
jgi:hypothetical protein